MKRSASDTLACFAIKRARLESLAQDEKETPQSPAKATPAADKVFNTAELVEQMLLNLDLHDLATTLRTNHFFRNVVFGSTKIKQSLFLLPDPEEPLRYLVDSSEGEIVAVTPRRPAPARSVHQTLLTAHLLNPSLRIDESKLTDSPHACSYLKPEDTITYGRHILLPYHAYVDSNLRDMLVLQPPVSKISFTAKPQPLGQVIDVDVTNDNGVRIGDLVQAVMHTGMVGNMQFLAGYLRADCICIATSQELRHLEGMVGKCCPIRKKFMREASARSGA